MIFRKLTGKETFVLMLCLTCYTVTVAGIVFFNRLAILLAFILHNGFLLLFCFFREGKQPSSIPSDIPACHSSAECGKPGGHQTNHHEIPEDNNRSRLCAPNTPPESACRISEAILLPSIQNTPMLSDILSIASETVSELLPFAQKAGIQIRISSECDTVMANADPALIRILFRNIIDNSIKYMQQAGSLVITLSRIGTDIFIVCKDNGAGLSEQETCHIFELNYQGANRVSGSGLGLTQAKAIVTACRGTIYARSMPQKGMAIYIRLPAG